MDLEAIKTLGPLLGGALALIGGVLTFLNGRLKDAEGPQQQARIYTQAIAWLVVGLNIAGLIGSLLSAGLLVPLIFFSAALGIQIWIFASNKHPASRIEVATLMLMCSVYSILFSTSIVFSIANRMIGVIEKLIKLQTPLS